MHTDTCVGASQALETFPGVTSLFSRVDRTLSGNGAQSGLLPRISTSAAPPLEALLCLLTCLFSVGHANFHSSESQSTLEGSSVSLPVS